MAAGWSARIDRAIGRIGLGLFLFALGSGLLWWNEGRLAVAYRAIGAEQAKTPELAADRPAPAAFEGRLVQVSGLVESDERYFDADFGVGGRTLRLERRTQCWDGRRWRDAVLANAAVCLLPDLAGETFTARKARFGVYRLPPELASQIDGLRPLDPTFPDPERRERLIRRLAAARPDPAGRTPIHVVNGSFYLGRDPRTPETGDMRVSFLAAPPSAWITVLARLRGDTFEPYPTEDGASLFALGMGRASMAPGFAAERERSRLEAWALRGAGALSVICGLKLFAGPLAALAGPVPIVGAVVGAGAGLIGAFLGLVWSLVVVALAWLRFRPLAACPMLAASAVLLFFLCRRRE